MCERLLTFASVSELQARWLLRWNGGLNLLLRDCPNSLPPPLQGGGGRLCGVMSEKWHDCGKQYIPKWINRCHLMPGTKELISLPQYSIGMPHVCVFVCVSGVFQV